MAYNYRKLLGKITEVYVTQAAFADAMDLSERSLSLKLNNQRMFKQEEISRASDLLHISLEDIPAYFFTQDVQAN